MPRPIKQRVSYRDDAGFLLRLEAAVLKDARQHELWRRVTTKVIRWVAMRLLEADARENMGAKKGWEGKVPAEVGASSSSRAAASK